MSDLGPDPRHRPGTGGYRRLNVAMACTALAAFGILYSAQPLLPLIAETYDVSAGASSLSVSAATGALAVAVLPGTALASRIGRVRAMRGALVLAAVLTAVAAAAPTFEALVALRAAAGLALAAVVGTAMGHVGSQVHPVGLGAAMGVHVAGNSFGGVSGRLLGSLAADLSSWRVGMLAIAALAAVATVLFWRLLPEPVNRVVGPDPVRRTGGRGGRLANASVVALTVLPFVTMGGFVAVYNYLSFRLVAPPFSLPAALVGLVFLAYLIGTAGSVVTGRLADRFGRPPLLFSGLALAGVGLVTTLPDVLAVVVLGLLLFTLGFFVVHSTASGWMQAVTGPDGDRGGALYVTAYYAGSSVFGAALGVAWEASAWPGVAAGVGALLGVGLLAGLVVTLRQRRSGLAP